MEFFQLSIVGVVAKDIFVYVLQQQARSDGIEIWVIFYVL